MSESSAIKQVLVIEDEAPIRMLVSRLLRQNKYHVTEAVDGLDALHKLESFAPDLIIADIMMPHLDGLGLTKALKNRRETRDIPVIFLTARNDAPTMIEGINAGARFYVTKPFQIMDLLSKIKHALK